ncbi:polyprenyl synthetase family protein [Streptomyces chrestomyceticus]|uniref:polyprenyl synthetase family protein n=1 Tax=Streptomyces chrestomyceticus TaxID=68185 RepID=UPI00378D96A7
MLLEQAGHQVRPVLKRQVTSFLKQVQGQAGYHLGWQDETGKPCAVSSGKAVRPALALAAAKAVGGRSQDALPAAGAVQMVHDFSLLHDDIIDGDRTRRHRPAVWSVFGIPDGILTGDALLALAFATLTEGPPETAPDALRCLADAVTELVEGEALDVAFEQRRHVSLNEYGAMAGAKTGALMACACTLGALAGGAGGERAQLLGAFGRHVGIAFQIVDDLLGLRGDPAVTGKPVGADLASGKKTMPLLAALGSGTRQGQELAALLAGKATLDRQALTRAALLVEEAGGVSTARRFVHRELVAAFAALAEAVPAEGDREELRALAHVLTHRSH